MAFEFDPKQSFIFNFLDNVHHISGMPLPSMIDEFKAMFISGIEQTLEPLNDKLSVPSFDRYYDLRWNKLGAFGNLTDITFEFKNDRFSIHFHTKDGKPHGMFRALKRNQIKYEFSEGK